MNHGYLYTKDLTVGYNGIPLIRNIQLEINKGEIVTLIGPNGAGKTTILRSIIQQLPPVCGVVWLSLIHICTRCHPQRDDFTLFYSLH